MKSEEDILIENLMNDTKNAGIVLYNDEVNSFENVIFCLIAYCKHTLEQAEQCAYLVHTKGKYKVKTDSFEKLLPICNALVENGLNAKIEE